MGHLLGEVRLSQKDDGKLSFLKIELITFSPFLNLGSSYEVILSCFLVMSGMKSLGGLGIELRLRAEAKSWEELTRFQGKTSRSLDKWPEWKNLDIIFKNVLSWNIVMGNN